MVLLEQNYNSCILKCHIKTVPPNFYGLRKIHKSDVPLRPNASFVGALTYCIAKILVGILSSLLCLEYTVQKSCRFVQLVHYFQCFDDGGLVSFDVFTFTPVPDTLSIISNLLMSDNSLHELMNLTDIDVIKSVQPCLHSTIISFNSILYQQILVLQ